MIKDGDKVLVSTDAWFLGNDGESYKAAYGKVKMLTFEECLGFKPKKSENWALRIGTDEDFIIIAGCQIHYIVKSNERPLKKTKTYIDRDTGTEGIENRILFLD